MNTPRYSNARMTEERAIARELCLAMGILLALLLVLALTGCASYQYGPARVTSFGVDPTVESFRWERSGTNELIEIRGVKRTGGEAGSHTIGVILCTAIGAVCGTAIQPGGGTTLGITAGAAKGAAIGGSASEVWQTVKDWVRSKTGGKGIAGK
jgi:hypothetical protein